MIPNSLASRRFLMVLLAIWLSLYGFTVPASAVGGPVDLAWDPSSDSGSLDHNVSPESSEASHRLRSIARR
jgi:hypothetical protein